jgi:glycosyltransferase involved in cell wall biosynthesis
MKIILFANTDWYLYNFRLSLAQSLREQGHQVILVSPKGLYSSRLQALGFHWIEFGLARRGLNPIFEGLSLLRLACLYWRMRPELVHHFTVKCVLYGSFVSRLVGVKSVINSVTGLGYVFTEGNSSPPWLRTLILLLYRLALQGTSVIFQNPEDRKFFLQKNLVDKQKSTVIRGSGVDILRFAPTPESSGVPLVVLPSRLLWDKGVAEFISAAQLLRAEGIKARFALIGKNDPDNPSSIPVEQLRNWEQAGLIEWWGWREDMSEVYAQAHLVCLPTYYREGIPKVLIEAAACGRAIVTSDISGCCEIVRGGENGLLVPMRDPRALADAIQQLLTNPSQRRQMGLRGREIAVKEFAQEQVLSQTISFYFY